MNSEYTAKSYIQDGLVAIWDGIENAGFGIHDEDAIVWIDCINRRVWKGINATYDKDSYTSNGGQSTDVIFMYLDLVNVERTREIVFKPKRISFTNDPILCGTGDRSLDFSIYASRDLSVKAYYRNGQIFFNANGDDVYQQLYLAVVNLSNATSGYVNGIKTLQHQSFYSQQGNTVFPATALSNTITIYAFRVYNRALSKKEIEHNYIIDKIRFGL